MHDRINSITFWENVKFEFEESSHDFLCHGSSFFREAWEKQEFRDAALMMSHVFLSEAKQEKYMRIAPITHQTQSLFCYVKPEDYRPIREQFINWNIQRLQKP